MSWNDRVIARRTWSKRLPTSHALSRPRASHTLVAKAKLYSLGGEQTPYFSLTGELINNRTRNTNSEGIESCGAMGDTLEKEWPELARINELHLAWEDGQPMHAVENGLYWLGFTKYQNRDLDAFARLWRLRKVEAQEAYAYVKASENPREAVGVLACAMLPRWADDARRGLELLRGGEPYCNHDAPAVRYGVCECGERVG